MKELKSSYILLILDQHIEWQRLESYKLSVMFTDVHPCMFLFYFSLFVVIVGLFLFVFEGVKKSLKISGLGVACM